MVCGYLGFEGMTERFLKKKGKRTATILSVLGLHKRRSKINALNPLANGRAGKDNGPSNQWPRSHLVRPQIRASTILQDGVWISGI